MRFIKIFISIYNIILESLFYYCLYLNKKKLNFFDCYAIFYENKLIKYQDFIKVKEKGKNNLINIEYKKIYKIGLILLLNSTIFLQLNESHIFH